MARLPYPGLRPFFRDEADLFFGRDEETGRILDILMRSRFLCVLGASGSGKSSLVRAGLLQALEAGLGSAGPSWQFIEMRPGATPFARLAEALAEASPEPDGGGSAQIHEALRRGPRSIVEWREADHLKPGTNLLILVDQFEELFSLTAAESREEAHAFASLVVESARSERARIYIVLVMRSEYFGACGVYPELTRAVSESLFLVPRMLRESCQETIRYPAQVLGFEIEDDLILRLLNDLEAYAAVDGDIAAATGQRREHAHQLPIMQFVLRNLSRLAEARTERLRLTEADYLSIGGLERAIHNEGEETMASVPVSVQAVEGVFRSLLAGSTAAVATRVPRTVAEIADIASLDEDTVRVIVSAFARDDRQFLHCEMPIRPDSYVDIRHEDLIWGWRRLSEWFEREREAAEIWQWLAQGASEWNRQAQEEGMVLVGTALSRRVVWWQAERPSQGWANRYPIEGLDGEPVSVDLVDDYLRAGLARQSRTRRHLRTLYWLLAGAALSFTAAAAFEIARLIS